MFNDGFNSLDIAITALSLTWLGVLLYQRSSAALHLPPGPTPLPLIGNVLQVPKTYEWVQYATWAKRYGPIVTLKFLGQRVFVLNSHESVSAMLEKNMNAYAGRPINMVMASELIGWGRAVALNPGGHQHQKYRKLLSTSLNSTAVRKYRAAQEQSAITLLRAFLDSPNEFLKHIRLVVGLSIVEFTYGHDLKIGDVDYIDYAEGVHEVFALAAKPFAFLVDLIPSLKFLPRWMPGMGFKTKADQWRQDLELLAKEPFNTVKNEVTSGQASESYVSNLLQEPNNGTEEDDIMWTAASLYTGGSDTSICSLTAFVLLMCTNPEKQIKAQRELDEVTGRERLPTFDDQARLPYLAACVKEVLRYWTVAPLGLPHRVMEDDRYGSYHIPKGSTVVGNIWGIMHDPAVYSRPFEFMPERFMPRSAGGLDEENPVPTVFGWGRRICPGMHLAEASLWIYAAHILATMDIRPVKDEHGVDVPPKEDASPGIISFPKPFECSITPRSKEVVTLISQ